MNSTTIRFTARGSDLDELEKDASAIIRSVFGSRLSHAGSISQHIDGDVRVERAGGGDLVSAYVEADYVFTFNDMGLV